ncbi:MAG TPA: hypothetical protein VHP11_09965, partial [Tepidisphaeraceae bacterium]|nr:hypothetical protein [Tepidisphaeraceae bacterium]
MESGLTPERRNDIIQQCAEHLRRGCNIDDGRQAIKAKFATLSEQEIDGMLTAAQSLANGTATATVSSTAANPVVTATQPEAQNFDDAVIAAMEDLDRDIKTLGITQEHMDVAENWIKARITDRALTKINQSLSAMGRRNICYQDIAAIALFHRRSV